MHSTIKNHISHHQVAKTDEAAVFLLYPKGLQHMDQNFMQSIAKRSMDAYSDNFGEQSNMFFNAWGLSSSHLIPALQSLPGHFRRNQTCDLHLFFVCHGVPEEIVWSRGKHIAILDILQSLKSLQFSQLKSVSFLSCNSLQRLPSNSWPFHLLGFVNYVYWNEMPFFLARMVKEISAGETFKKSWRIAVRCCNCNLKTPMKLKDVFFQPKSL